MCKSLGNLVFISDLLKGPTPRAIRLALMHHHYRSGFEWYDTDIEDGTALLHRLLAAAAASRRPRPARRSRARVRAALDDDLDAPGALEALGELADAVLSGGERRDRAGRAARARRAPRRRPRAVPVSEPTRPERTQGREGPAGNLTAMSERDHHHAARRSDDGAARGHDAAATSRRRSASAWPRRRSSPRSTASRGRPRPADRPRRDGRDRHRRSRRRAGRSCATRRPRAGPGRARRVPRRQLRHRPAHRRRLLLRLRAARRRSTFTPDDLERIDGPDARDHRRAPAVRPRRDRPTTRPRAVRRPAVQARDHRKGAAPAQPTRTTRARSPATATVGVYTNVRQDGDRRVRRPVPRPARARHRPARRVQADAGGRRLLARRREEPDAAAHLRHGVGDREGALAELPAPARGGRARDHRKLGAELDLFSFPDEIGSGLAVFHPKGGTDPPAHGGLQPRSATSRPATSSCTRPTSPSRTCSRLRATSTGSPTACSRRWSSTAARSTTSSR